MNTREAVVREYQPGELVCRQGSGSNRLYVLKSGKLRRTVLPERLLAGADDARMREAAAVYEIAEPDALINLDCALAGQAQGSLIADAPTTLVEIPVDARGLTSVISAQPQLGVKLARSLAARLKDANRSLNAGQRRASRFLRDFQALAAEFYTLVQDQGEGSAGQDDLIGALNAAKRSRTYFFGESAGAEYARASRALFSAAMNELARRELSSGDYLCRKGEPGGSVFLLANGRLSVRVGNEVFGVIQPGEMIGELGALQQEPETKWPADIVADMDSECGLASAADFTELLSRHPRILINLCRSLTMRVRTFEQLTAEPGDALGALRERLEGLEQDINELRRGLDLLLEDQELPLESAVAALADIRERWNKRMEELAAA